MFISKLKRNLSAFLTKLKRFKNYIWANKKRKRRAIIGAIIFIVALFYWLTISSPANFPAAKLVKIQRGSSNDQIAESLSEQNVIRCELCFKAMARLLPGKNTIVAGSYVFAEREPLPVIFYRVVRGEFGITPYKVTIPEGTSNRVIAKILEKRLPNFNAQMFLNYSSNMEGSLFPDTYIFTPDMNEKDVIKIMSDNFDSKIASIQKDLATTSHSLREILIMASIIEKEVRTPADRRMVSGVLWGRIEKGMRLQVDAVFKYIMDKSSSELTKADLATSSPYNTYRNKGLPPTPITNPGLDSILAAIYPTKTSNLFYLSDANGTTRFAKTLDGHKENRLYMAD